MAKIEADVESIDWWVNTIAGLLDKGEWKVLILTLMITFSVTYILKIIYNSFIYDNDNKNNHIRLIAILSGYIAAYFMWSDHAISMEWYVAGTMMGWLSISIHHTIEGISKTEFIKKRAPWLYPVVKGQKEKRKGVRK